MDQERFKTAQVVLRPLRSRLRALDARYGPGTVRMSEDQDVDGRFLLRVELTISTGRNGSLLVKVLGDVTEFRWRGFQVPGEEGGTPQNLLPDELAPFVEKLTRTLTAVLSAARQT